MLPLNIPVIVAGALVPLAFYKFVISPAFLSPLAKVPSAHWSAPFSPLWILWIRYRRQENRKLHAAHLRLGPVIRLGPNEISVNDLTGLRIVYGGGFEKGDRKVEGRGQVCPRGLLGALWSGSAVLKHACIYEQVLEGGR